MKDKWYDRTLTGIAFTVMLGWLVFIIGKVAINDSKKLDECTPTQEHQQILEQLSGVKADLKEFKQESDERQVNLYTTTQDRFDELVQLQEYLFSNNK